MGSASSREAFLGCIASICARQPKAILPAPSCPQTGNKCTIHHTFSRRNSVLHKLYEVSEDQLGEGSFGVVRPTKCKESGTSYVLKTVATADMPQTQLVSLANEIAIHETCDHPCIVRIFEKFEDPKHIHIAMERCDGGELYDFVQGQGGTLNEADAALFMKQVMQAVYYLHEVKQVVHRDIKLENLLLKYRDVAFQENVVKVIDFGFAHSFTPGEQSLTDLCGTPVYMAPEIPRKPYDEKCDIWSCGVMLHEVLCGSVPFDGPKPMQILKMAATLPLHLQGELWDAVSQEAKDLVSDLLKKAPDERPSAERVLKSQFIMGSAASPYSPTTPGSAASPSTRSPGRRKIGENLKAFSSLSGFQKMAKLFAAYRLDDPAVAEQRKIFKRLDKNGDGRLSLQEISGGCPKLGLSAAEAQELFQHLDTDGSGTIEYTEFLSAAVSKDALPQHTYQKAFRVFDKDGSGSISEMEVRAVASVHSSRDSVQLPALSEEGAQDGEMKFDNFVRMM